MQGGIRLQLSRKKWTTLAMASLVALMLAITACGGGGSSDQGGGSAGSGDAGGGSDGPTVSGPIDLKFGTLDQGTAWYAYGASIAQLLQQVLPAGSTVDVLSYSGSIGNPKLVSDSKEAHLGFTFSVAGSWAYNGTPDTGFEKPLPSLRVLVGGMDQYWLGAMVPANAPFNSLKDVKEKQMGINVVSLPKGALGDTGTWMVMNAYGITEDDIKSWGGTITRASADVIANAIKDRRADYLMSPIVAGHPTFTELAQTSDIKFLPVEDEIVEKLKPLGMSGAVMPAGLFRGQDEDVPMLGFNTTLIADESMDDDLAYLITKTVIEGAEKLKADNKGMASFDPAKAWSEEFTAGVPLHPGAERYYKEAGLMP